MIGDLLRRLRRARTGPDDPSLKVLPMRVAGKCPDARAGAHIVDVSIPDVCLLCGQFFGVGE